jgi:RNA polymerase primary sigma factor
MKKEDSHPVSFPDEMEKDLLPGFATLDWPVLGEGELPLERPEGEKWEVLDEAFDQNETTSSPHLKDFLRLYLSEAGAYELLTLEEEVELARRVWEGQEAAKRLGELLELDHGRILRAARARVLDERLVPKFSTLSEDEVRSTEALCRSSKEARRLYQLVRDGEEARKHLLLANLRLVVSTTKPMWKKRKDIPFLDLIAEGNRGLLRATETFDYRKRIKFSTYATWWIMQAAQRYIYGSSRLIRLPVHQEEALAKIRNAQGILFQRLGRSPSPEEVAEFLGGNWTGEAVRERLVFGQEVHSLDEPTKTFDENDGSRLQDFVPAEGKGPEALAEAENLRQHLFEILDSFPPKHRAVLSLRFGLETGTPLSLAEVGERMGVSRERVRQIEKEALRRLRKHPEVFALKDFLE